MKQRFSTKLVGLLVLICAGSISLATKHTVTTGDTLYGLSKKYKVSIEQIQTLNHLKGTRINFGQVLVIHPEKVKAPEVTIPEEVPAPAVEKEVEKNLPLPKEEPEIEPQKEFKPEPVVKGLAALDAKQRVIVREQILLDRNGMGPGIIDGYTGDFTRTAKANAAVYRPNTFNEKVNLLQEKAIPAEAFTYLNVNLPGTGAKPDFTEATEQQCLMMYKSSLEMLAERYHSSEKLLVQLNPDVDFSNIVAGQKILVPNVAEFRIEDFMNPAGEQVKHNYIRKTRRATRVDIDYGRKRIMVYHNSGKAGAEDELLAAFPVTTNIKEGPTTTRTIEYFAPAPEYARAKTGLKLRPGPNSPVGIVWGRLGSGYGIHGTSDGAGNGYNTSSGCIRLSNWDMAIFVKIVPAKIPVNFLLDGVALIPKSENKVQQAIMVDEN